MPWTDKIPVLYLPFGKRSTFMRTGTVKNADFTFDVQYSKLLTSSPNFDNVALAYRSVVFKYFYPAHNAILLQMI